MVKVHQIYGIKFMASIRLKCNLNAYIYLATLFSYRVVIIFIDDATMVM